MRKLVPPIVLLAVWVFTFVVFEQLPAHVATHWDIVGEADGWSSRAVAASLLPAILTVMFVLFTWFVPRIEATGESLERFQRTYDTLSATTLAALGAVHVAVLGEALGWGISVGRTVPVVVGVLFVVFGRLLPGAQPNWLFGIRTPWALSSERAWERTHRVGGPLLALGGVCIAASAFVRADWSFVVMMAGVVGFSLATVGYSWWVCRQEEER